METRSVYAVDLEIRSEGDRPVITGRFPYGALAVIGRTRQERFMPGVFSDTLREGGPEINFLLSHDMARPLASRSAGTLVFNDSPEALAFEATMPPEGQQTTWQRDFMLAHGQGLIGGISPGFNVMPKARFPNAESEAANPGIPGTTIRTIRAASLGEFSAVTRAVYPDATLESRDDEASGPYWRLNPEALLWL